ncbi:MAG TPA: hypothetical protein PK911_04995 [Candidatus Saccharibacteria bacterium]|nr:hypothetical protein [Candidatus Saccharibacteria bacterium]
MERRAVKIENNVVTNVLIIDDDTPKDLYDVELEEGSNVSIGWKYDGSEFTEPKQPKQKPTE